MIATAASCGLFTGDYTVGQSSGGAGGSSSCTRLLFDDFDEPLAIHWNVDGAPSLGGGAVTFEATSGIDTEDSYDLSAGACLTVKFASIDLPHPDERMTVRLSNPGIDLQIAMEASGDVIAAYSSSSPGSDVLIGLRQDGTLRAYWRLCIDSAGQGSFFVSTDGAVFDDVSPSSPVLSAPFDTTLSSVSISMLQLAGSSPSASIDWVELCGEAP